jgi:hypothetical protein
MSECTISRVLSATSLVQFFSCYVIVMHLGDARMMVSLYQVTCSKLTLALLAGHRRRSLLLLFLQVKLNTLRFLLQCKNQSGSGRFWFSARAPTIIYEDNELCISIARKKSRTKHIKI